MNVAVIALLALAVITAWIMTVALLRLRANLDRLHVITFFNLVVGGAITLAAMLQDGLTGRTFQCALVWLVLAGGGALTSHAIARALHLREGQHE